MDRNREFSNLLKVDIISRLVVEFKFELRFNFRVYKYVVILLGFFFFCEMLIKFELELRMC